MPILKKYFKILISWVFSTTLSIHEFLLVFRNNFCLNMTVLNGEQNSQVINVSGFFNSVFHRLRPNDNGSCDLMGY